MSHEYTFQKNTYLRGRICVTYYVLRTLPIGKGKVILNDFSNLSYKESALRAQTYGLRAEGVIFLIISMADFYFPYNKKNYSDDRSSHGRRLAMQ